MIEPWPRKRLDQLCSHIPWSHSIPNLFPVIWMSNGLLSSATPIEMVNISKMASQDHNSVWEVFGSSLGPIKPAWMVFNEGNRYSIKVLLITGLWKDPLTRTYALNWTPFLLAISGYVTCPGIINYDNEAFSQSLGCHPVTRYDSATCDLRSNVRSIYCATEVHWLMFVPTAKHYTHN